MSLVDVAIPLVAGIAMVARPQMLLKRAPADTDETMAAKKAKLRKLGYGLLAVAALYCTLP